MSRSIPLRRPHGLAALLHRIPALHGVSIGTQLAEAVTWNA